MNFDTMFAKGALPTLERSLGFHVRRHDVIAHNIANAVTPFYKAQDLPVDKFNAALTEAMEIRDARTVKTMRLPDEGELAARPPSIDATHTGILRHDENNFSVEHEMVRLAKNTGKINTMIAMLTQQMDLLETAIRERVA